MSLVAVGVMFFFGMRRKGEVRCEVALEDKFVSPPSFETTFPVASSVLILQQSGNKTLHIE